MSNVKTVPATDVLIFKNISQKNWRKKSAYLAKTQTFTNITLVFKKNANIFAENLQKSLQLLIITLTPANLYRKEARRKLLNKIQEADLVSATALKKYIRL
jgi:hypothetical protein